MADRKIKLFISMSIDGYLAGEADDLSWMSFVEKDGEDYGYAEFSQTIDTYIVGRRTYDVILKLAGGTFPQSEKWDCHVLTRTPGTAENGVSFPYR